jgi:hypothetical protein
MQAPAARPVKTFGDAFSVWTLEVDAETPEAPPVRVHYFRTEGGGMTADQREDICAFYRSHIVGDLADDVPFVQIFDLQNGFEGAEDHLMPLALFCKSIRPQQEAFLQRSFIICDDGLVRSVIRCVLQLSPPCKPFVLCDNEEEVWSRLLGTLDGCGELWGPAS